MKLFKNIHLIDTFIVFMLIFAFPVIPFFNSSKIALLISLVGVVFNKRLFKRILTFLISKEISRYFLALICFIVFSFLLTVLLNEYDFSLLKKQISSFIYLIFLLVFFIYFRRENLFDLIVNAFILQSIFIFLSIIYPFVFEMLTPFRLEIDEYRYSGYNRIRGNAVSGYQFFGISCMYGFVILAYILKMKINNFRQILIFSLLTLAGVLSGRYTIVAVFLGFFVRFFSFSNITNRIKFLFKNFLIVLLFSFVFIFGYNNIIDSNQKMYLDKFILDPIVNVNQTGKLRTGSTDHLLRMYSEFKLENLLFGEGRYIARDGKSYYGKVDAGFLRLPLYCGVLGTFFLFYLQYLFLFKFSWYDKKNSLIHITFLFYFILLNFKGDVFFYSNNVTPIVLGILFFSSFNENKTLKKSQVKLY